MASSTTLRVGLVRLLVMAVLASMLAVGAGTDPASAEDPPSFITKWGTPGTGNGQFDHPFGVAVDGDGNVYVADTYNNRVQKFTSTGAYLTQWGTFGSGNGQFYYPYGVTVDGDGDVYVADLYNHRVQKFTSTGAYVTQWGTQGTGNGQFDAPGGVAVDGDGNVYVTDRGNSRVQKFTSTGAYLTQWGTQGTGNGQFNGPLGVAVDSDGEVYVADELNNRVQKFSSTGAYLTQWGTWGTGNSQFDRPDGVAVDGDGDVYVADSGNNRVQVFTFTGTFRFLRTKWGTYGTGDGQFNEPEGVAVDGSGNVYVADTFNNRIQRFGDVTDPTVVLTTPPAVWQYYARNQAVTADFSCTDESGGSGIATCVGTVPDGQLVPTATLGQQSFTVTATDRAGNTGTRTHHYVVADPRPDGRIRKGATGTYFGDDIYNTTGVGQTRTGAAARGGTVTYYVSVQNDAPFPDTLRLRGTASTAAFRVLYSTGGVDITPQVAAGTYTTPTLAPGATFEITVEVKVKTSAPAGSSLTGALTAKSTTDLTIKDKVKFVTRRS